MADGRIIIIALCGGADRPIGALGGRTPFEAATTPHLDALARRGASGLLEVIAPDVPPESDSGTMALLGYDPVRHYTGRGPLEGLGMGFWSAGGTPVAFRINFASWDPRTGQLDRRTSRDLADEDLAVLVAEIVAGVRLGDGLHFELTGFARHRGILAFSSTGLPLSGRVSNTDPGFANVGAFGIPVKTPENRPLPCRALVDDPAAHRTAAVVNEFVTASAEVLQRSEVNRRRVAQGRRPANLLLIRDGGDTLPTLPPFAGGSLRMYGQVPAERGLASLIGADFVVARKGPGQTDAEFYAELVPRLLADPSDVVFAHLKGPDEPGHDGQPAAKTAAIADIDCAFVGPLVAGLRPADTLVVTCDHATPCELGIHSPDPVPTVVAGPGVTPDDIVSFGERDAGGGGLPVHRASELMPWLTALRTADLRVG
ncbi:CMP-5'-phosphonoformate--3-phosphoglycerate phosphonoformyl transferase [Solwaraspora sp. WMMD1047]|uniref:CMP-5'-phosphonoformate--3-phosphoglycerate phosphonoformyl transferase n=1 Tax=Solwaraspora sp. WMMD1047 TaxID=3016102 RepID=UPI002415DA11|nr:CMP-5'-phosphonoformate--3-phosphoglycerate phosphonoformyl transferase [Solwaraspora sp. WMMD1047]MDG4834261.1 CMP-5'-phosphonoformate--3-phosphoglycerate phosphonoformyl transferase [Solwaraspora sp. WMMD1047]